MPNLATLIQQLLQSGDVLRIARNPAAQFGTPTRRYLGAELLPERTVQANAYTEDQIRFRTVIANAGPRYGPTQKKGGVLVGSFEVKLAESDIAAEFTSQDYDALLRFLQQNLTIQATATVVNFLDSQVNIPLIEWIERARWQALVSAQVNLRGDNEFTEDIDYANPSGHRAAAGGTWSNDSYDPFLDIYAMADLLASKGFAAEQGRIVTSRNVVSILAGNAKVQARAGRILVSTGGQIQGGAGRATLGQINAALREDGLPVIELYDLQYRTSTSTGRFMPNSVLCLFGATGQQAEIDLGDTSVVLDNVLGYAAVGRPAGQSDPGRFIRAEAKEDKPPRIEAEGWQTVLPVVQEPESMAVISSIA